MKLQNIKKFLFILFWIIVFIIIIIMSIKFILWRFDTCMDVFHNTLYCLTK